MNDELVDKMLKLGRKYNNKSHALSEIQNALDRKAYAIKNKEESIKNLEKLINRKSVDFSETIKFYSLKKDKEYIHPVQDIEIKLDNAFTIDTIKKFLQEQVEVLKGELEELIAEGEIIYKKYEKESDK